MKKILIVHNLFWTHYKAKVHSELHILTEKSNKYKLQVLHLAGTDTGRENLGKADESIHKYPYKILFPSARLDRVGSFELCIKLIKEFNKLAPDILICGYMYPSLIVLILYASLSRKKIIIVIDSTKADKRRRKYKEFVKKIIVRCADRVICYGTASKLYAMSLGVNESQVDIRCQATDNDAVRRAYLEKGTGEDFSFKCARNFIYVGRLIKIKNVLTLLKAFKLSRANNHDWGLIIVGDGDCFEGLRKYTRDNKIAGVNFVGGVSWKEVIYYLKKSDVFILPSLSEPWGLVVNEAMLCEMPVVVSEKCGCAVDLVRHSENGFVFNPYKVDDLSNVMKQFFGFDDNRLKEMGQASYDLVKDRTPQHSASQFLQAVNNLYVSGGIEGE